MSLARYRRVVEVYQETSGEAWDAFQEHLAAVDLQILDVMRDGGATSDEVEAHTGLKHQTVSAQIRHMAEAGLLVDSGARRPTRSGRAAIVWAIAPRPAPTSAPGRDPIPAEEGWLF